MSFQSTAIVRKGHQRWPTLTLFVFFALTLIYLTAPALNGRAAGKEPPDAGTVSEAQAPAETPPPPPAQLTGSQVVTIPASNPAAQQDGSSAALAQRIEVEPITITPRGFEPLRITRPTGRFILSVQNRSGLNSVTLRVDQAGGIRLLEVQVPRQRLDWRGFLTLIPGQYTLSDANHPSWSCRITIAP